MLIARYLGASVAADAFNAAFKIPNFLQNLFGEGALSASFIPVYARCSPTGDEEEAGPGRRRGRRVLALVVSVSCCSACVATPRDHPADRGGFTGEKRELTIRLTRILFPGAGIFVMSRVVPRHPEQPSQVLLSYSAPVLWNVAMIVALLWFGRSSGRADLAVDARVGIGGRRRAAVPGAAADRRSRWRKHFALRLDTTSPHVRDGRAATSGRSFVSRGVVQISAYIDQLHRDASCRTGMVATLGYAQTIYVLPVSLFGMAVSAARAAGDVERRRQRRTSVSRDLRARLDARPAPASRTS